MGKVWRVGKVWEQARLVIAARQCEEVDVTVIAGSSCVGKMGRVGKVWEQGW